MSMKEPIAAGVEFCGVTLASIMLAIAKHAWCVFVPAIFVMLFVNWAGPQFGWAPIGYLATCGGMWLLLLLIGPVRSSFRVASEISTEMKRIVKNKEAADGK